jgi:release factor glutamine methyltransferase
MVTVGTALRAATSALDGSESAALDAQLLLASVLGKSRSWLYTWPEQLLAASSARDFEGLVRRRAAGEPVAYLVGSREFWSLPLRVSPAVLIPRPETETLVRAVLDLLPTGRQRVADLGTGSGAIALALASERPQWELHATDCSQEALQQAQDNVRALGLTVQLHLGDWLEALPDSRFDALVSNPPYLADSDPHLQQGDLRFEPRSALVAADDGHGDLNRLAAAAPAHLGEGGWLLLEHGWQQGGAVRTLLRARGFVAIQTRCDEGGRERVTQAQWPGAAHG